MGGFSTLGGGVTIFTGLTDTPNSYAGYASYLVSVKSTEDGLEFAYKIVGDVGWCFE